MAFSHHKFTIGAEQTAGQVTSYLADPQAAGDYYSEADHAFMRWLVTDRARAELALGDFVELAKVERLINGQHPETGELIRRWGPNRTMVGGQDCTLSPAPKSVSILWALADQGLRDELERMIIGAAAGAIAVMLGQEPLLRERYGPGGNDRRFVTAQDYVGVQALHTTARLTEAKPGIPDPDLHVHSVVFGALDTKGRLRALESRQILNYGAQLDGHASARLAELLRLRGFEIDRELVRDAYGKVKRVAWEVKGVPQELIKAMSARSREIEDLKRRYREATGREAEGPGWERFVTSHRGPKAKSTSTELRAAWEAEATEHGYGPEAVAAAKAQADARRAAGIPERREESPEAQELRREILADLTREYARVPRRKLDALAQQHAVGLVAPVIAEYTVAEMFGDGDLLLSTDGLYVTTLEVLAAEQRTTKATERLLGAPPAPAADLERLEAEFREQEENGSPFDLAQREAITVATSGAHFVSIAGPAGTGKGYATRAMVDVWHSQGRRVIALAVAGRTAQQAQADSGADLGLTLDGLTARVDYDALQLRPSDVLLVDEAAMVDHWRYAPLLEAAADSSATLIQVGDDKQLSPVEAGGLWTVTHAMAAERNLAVELRTVRRARNPAEAQAWTDLRNGNVEKGLLWYRDEGRLRLYDTRPELIHGIVNDWWARSMEDRGVMVIDTTNAERDSANRIAQAKRLQAGELGAEALELTNGRGIHAGDLVLFHEIHQLNRDLNAHGPRIENGTTATVLQLAAIEMEDRNGLYPSERGQRGHQLPAERGIRAAHYPGEIAAAAPAPPNVAVLELHEPHGSRLVTVGAETPLELGYARHVYKAQGMTAEVANIGTGPQTSQERLYVMASRSRDGTNIHALRSEIEEIGAEPAHLEPPRQTALPLGEAAPVSVEAPEAAQEAAQPQHTELPEGAISGAELQAQLAQARAQLEARELVTVREIAHRAKSEAKQAAGRAGWSQPAPTREPERGRAGARLDLDREAFAAAERDHELNPRHEPVQHDRSTSAVMRHTPSQDELRANARQRYSERIERAYTEADTRYAEGLRIPAGMPARSAAESVARMHAERGNTTELLAMYRSIDRLDMAQHPERAAVERAYGEPGSMIIAQDQAQLERLQRLVQERQEAGTRQEPAQASQEPQRGPETRQRAQEPPAIMVAQDAYRQRAEAREHWVQQTLEARRDGSAPAEAFQHRVEPGALDKAVVIVNDQRDAESLSRGLAGAAEAHLVTGQPDWLTGEAIRLRGDELRAQQELNAHQEGERQGAEAQRELVERSQEAEHSADRTAELAVSRGQERGIELER